MFGGKKAKGQENRSYFFFIFFDKGVMGNKESEKKRIEIENV